MSIADQITRIQNEVGIQSDKIAEILNAMENQKAIEASIINGTIAGEYRNDRITSLGEAALSYNTLLTSVNFPLVTNISYGAFFSCSALTSVTLGSSTMATLSNKSAFTNTPIASGTGYIYVPADLVDSYKAATNWSTYADQIKAIGEV